jgi:hypothetical protein
MNDPVFKQCSADGVFSEVTKAIGTSEVLALWVRIQQEIKGQSVGASGTYLNEEFVRLREQFVRELASATLSN